MTAAVILAPVGLLVILCSGDPASPLFLIGAVILAASAALSRTIKPPCKGGESEQ